MENGNMNMNNANGNVNGNNVDQQIQQPNQAPQATAGQLGFGAKVKKLLISAGKVILPAAGGAAITLVLYRVFGPKAPALTVPTVTPVGLPDAASVPVPQIPVNTVDVPVAPLE